MGKRLRANKRWHLWREHGQALAEFAFAMPILWLIILAIVQFAGVYNHYVSLTDATRAGARKAVVSRSASDPIALAKQAVCDSAPSLTCSSINVTVTPTPWSPGQEITVTASYPYDIDLMGVVVKSGDLTSSTKERVE